MKFAVRAINKDNIIQVMTVDALDLVDARQQVESQAHSVMEVRPLSGNALFDALGRKKISVLLFSQELLALLNAGLGLVEALDGLAEREGNHNDRTIIERIASSLREGHRFSTALQQQAEFFPPIFIGLVKSAEDTNDLPEALARFIDYQLKINTVKTKVINASIYPAILFLVGAGVTIFLIAFVVPKFATVYRESGRDLPWMSQLLLDWGKYASSQPLTLICEVAVVFVLVGIAIRSLIRSGKVQAALASIPWIGYNLRIYSLSRLYLTLGMLLKGGIPVVAALGIVRPTLPQAISFAVESAENQIKAGLPLSTAFDAAGLTTSISKRMLRVGERSGQLPDMLAQVAQFYDGDMERFLDRFTRAFEPLLMAGIGIVVGVIVILLYMPIFDLASSLQ